MAPPSREAQATAIKQLCTTAQSLCMGNNTQYATNDDCVKTLAAKPFGDGDNIWADSVNCRQIHILLARIRPDVSARLPAANVAPAEWLPRSIAPMSVPAVGGNASMCNTTMGISTMKPSSENPLDRISFVPTNVVVGIPPKQEEKSIRSSFGRTEKYKRPYLPMFITAAITAESKRDSRTQTYNDSKQILP